jgi:hypothetical protein
MEFHYSFLKSVVSHFDIGHIDDKVEDGEYDCNIHIEPISIGLINDTWIVTSLDSDGNISNQYILQRINHEVFCHPHSIDHNFRLMVEHIEQYHPNEIFPRLIPLKKSSSSSSSSPSSSDKTVTLLYIETTQTYFRMVDYIMNSYSLQVLESPTQAYEAAKAFGSFCRMFSTPSISSQTLLNCLQDTIPNFHNLILRYEQYQEALVDKGRAERIMQARPEINALQEMTDILFIYKTITSDSDMLMKMEKRVTHHDCKISNMLFDSHSHQGKCVVDLDTTMPGYFISDIGDMFRTFLSAHSEEEMDLSKVYVRMEYFEAVVEGYLSEMKDVLTKTELEYVTYAGEFIIYMQTLRFLTDFLLGDVYYKVTSEEHNLHRARNQLKLLQSYRACKPTMIGIVERIVSKESF